ncbi:hypothetical protein SAMN05216229_1239 [Geopseudomonas sagittaria]|uniref:Uncharacterized protein n=1 Tax=Geopseudomonas sagittaria TaxID=1135990 RepID=A0A1I5YNR2_9GAMM|nr:hypothetical protein [Pseudomonas sagittaria]SFQ45782.1 hypothetical protein SAMN05216229_1239 [Pseudomonas sagittaria]
MPIITEGLIVRRDRNLLDDVVTGQADAAEAAFDQSWFENPLSAVNRIQELGAAAEGEVIRPGGTMMGRTRETLRAPPTTPLVTADEARARVKEAGLDLTIEDSGIREGALEILMERKREENERQFVLQNAPGSTVPIQLLAGFAASAVDPINLASAFIPIVGEARYAGMLAKAGSRAARFGVRARVGALEGAAGAALLEPLTLYASAQDQSDYDITDSLMNVAFGTVLGGGLHSVGGMVSDMRRSRLRAEVQEATELLSAVAVEPIQAPAASRSQLANAMARADDDPLAALRVSLERGLADDRAALVVGAGRQAADELTPAIRAELEAAAGGKAADVRGLRAEQASLQRSLDSLGDTYRDRAKEFQGQRMTRKQAERAARDAIAQERAQLGQRQKAIANALDANRQAEFARADLASLRRGEIPERYRPRIDERARQIADGFELRDTARMRAENAPWQVRESALRTAVAQAVTGRQVDVEAIFDLADPAKRADAAERIKRPAAQMADAEAEQASRAAEDAMSLPDAEELDGAERLLADEQALTDEVAAQAGMDISPFTRAADEFMEDAEVYAAAYRAAAICQLRN